MDCAWHSGVEERLKLACYKTDALEKLVNSQLAAHKQALDLARVELERRLEGMNEFRAQLSTQANTFVTIKELRLELNRIEERLRPLSDSISVHHGGAKWTDHFITVIIATIVVIAMNHFFK